MKWADDWHIRNYNSKGKIKKSLKKYKRKQDKKL